MKIRPDEPVSLAAAHRAYARAMTGWVQDLLALRRRGLLMPRIGPSAPPSHGRRPGRVTEPARAAA